MKITTMLKCLCVIIALGNISTIGAYSLARYDIYGTAQKPQKHRLNCEDLGRCNLKTGEVFTMPEQSIEVAQAEVLQEIWGISDHEIAQPVELFREGEL